MTEDLEAEIDGLEVVGQIHAVPPHVVHEVRLNGRRAVLKRDCGPTATAGIEGRVMEFVGRRTAVPVPEVLLLADDFFVAEWHPGAPTTQEDQTADETWTRAAGKGVATLHAATAAHMDGYGVFQLEDGDLTTEEHHRWTDAIQDYLERRRQALEPYGHADIAESVASFLGEHPDRFVDTGSAVCCHGWATPEHVATKEGEVACMLDFEHAIAAPGEFDVWRTVLPLFGPAPESSAFTAFRDGYESVRSLPEGFGRREPLYRLLNGVYYLESLYVQDQHGPDETADRAERMRHNIGELIADLR